MGGSDTTDSMTQDKTTITLLGQDHGMEFYGHFDPSSGFGNQYDD